MTVDLETLSWRRLRREEIGRVQVIAEPDPQLLAREPEDVHLECRFD